MPTHTYFRHAVQCLMAPALLMAGFAGQAAERVFFEEPLDNAQVSSPVSLKFGVEGMTVANTRDKSPGTGHHHIIIDGGPVPKGEGIDVDESHIHYNNAQTSAKVDLPPGVHTLTLQFGNARHLSYGPDMSATITVTVKPK